MFLGVSEKVVLRRRNIDFEPFMAFMLGALVWLQKCKKGEPNNSKRLFYQWFLMFLDRTHFFRFGLYFFFFGLLRVILGGVAKLPRLTRRPVGRAFRLVFRAILVAGDIFEFKKGFK